MLTYVEDDASDDALAGEKCKSEMNLRQVTGGHQILLITA